jgi:hypothetical protein
MIGLIASRLAPVLNWLFNGDKSRISERDYLPIYSNYLDKYLRVSRPQLRLVWDSLSERDKYIIQAVNECKLLSSNQIQRLLFPELAHSSLTTAKTLCSRALNRLERKSILVRSARQSGGLYGGSKVYIYALGPIGARLAGKTSQDYSSISTGFTFLDHTLAISEFYVNLKELERSGTIKIIELQTEPSCWRSFLTSYGTAESLKQDMYLRLVNMVTSKEYYWFIEVDRSTARKWKIQTKAKVYERYYFDTRQPGVVFPRVLWIVPNAARQRQLKKYLEASNNLVKTLHLVVTTEQSLSVIAGNNVVK